MTELPPTLVQMQRLIAQGELSPAEALQVQRERVAALDARFHCVVSVPQPTPSDECPTGPLAGIGLAHKDIFDTEGHRPGIGHDAGAQTPGTRNARVLERLRQSGAAHLARLVMAEYACGATGANVRQRPCINPLHPQAVVGGSSSGSAVAVASGLAYGSLGTDTAGSVRIPAATCGVLGLKTTHGLVDLDGVAPLAPALDSVGLLARTAADAGQLLSAVAGRPLQGSPDPARHRVRPSSASLRIKAVIPNALDDQVAQALHGFMATWPRAAVVCDMPEQARLAQWAEVLLHAEASQVHRGALLSREVSPMVEAVALPGLVIAAEWVLAVRAQRAAQLRAFVAAHLRQYDLLVLPALAHAVPDWSVVTPGAPGFDAQRLVGLYRYMGFVNYLGLPSVVFPVAVDRRGLPIAVQVLARPFHDAVLLAWAAAVEDRLCGPAGFPSFSKPHV